MPSKLEIIRPKLIAAFAQVRKGETVWEMTTEGSGQTLLSQAYRVRSEKKAWDIKVSCSGPRSIRLTLKTPESLQTKKLEPAVLAGKRIVGVNQLVTTTAPNVESLAAIRTLLDLRLVETVEFVGTDEKTFKALKGSDRFLGKSTDHGYVIV